MTAPRAREHHPRTRCSDDNLLTQGATSLGVASAPLPPAPATRSRAIADPIHPPPQLPVATPPPTPAPGGLRSVLLRSTGMVLVGTAIGQGTSLIRTLIAARILGPSVYGIWLGLRLVIEYGAMIDLGALIGMYRNVSLLRGRGDEAEARRVQDTSFSFAMLMGSLGLAATALAAPFWRRAEERPLLVSLGALVLVNLLRGYYVSLFRATHRFREQTIAYLIGAGVTMATLPLIWIAGLTGFLWGLFAQVGAECLFLALRSQWPRLTISWPLLKRQLAFGLPAVVSGLVATTQGGIDRMVILGALDAGQLGLYGIAYIVVGLVTQLAAVPATVLSPRLAEQFGRTGRAADLVPLLIEPLRALGTLAAVLVGMGVVALPPLVRLFMPKYLAGIDSGRIALFASFSSVVILIAASCLSALDRVKRYVVILTIATAFTYGLARLSVHFWPSLPAVAIASGVGLVLYMIALLLAALRATGHTTRRSIAITASILAPYGYVLVCLLAIELAGARWQEPTAIPRALAGEALLLLLTAPLVRRALRQLLAPR